MKNFPEKIFKKKTNKKNLLKKKKFAFLSKHPSKTTTIALIETSL